MKTCKGCEKDINYLRGVRCYACEKEHEESYRKIYNANSERLAKNIPYFEPSSYIVDYDVKYLKDAFKRYEESYDGFDFNPDFQRGHVWTVEQQIAYIESFVSNILSDQQRTITLNCPDFNSTKKDDSDLKGFVVLDGLQRCTAIMDFVEGKFKAFGLSMNEFDNSKYSFGRKTVKIQVYSYQYKKDLLDHYLLFNSGGVVHSESEINRIKQMRSEL